MSIVVSACSDNLATGNINTLSESGFIKPLSTIGFRIARELSDVRLCMCVIYIPGLSAQARINLLYHRIQPLNQIRSGTPMLFLDIF